MVPWAFFVFEEWIDRDGVLHIPNAAFRARSEIYFFWSLLIAIIIIRIGKMCLGSMWYIASEKRLGTQLSLTVCSWGVTLELLELHLAPPCGIWRDKIRLSTENAKSRYCGSSRPAWRLKKHRCTTLNCRFTVNPHEPPSNGLRGEKGSRQNREQQHSWISWVWRDPSRTTQGGESASRA